jgi:hypothetical protein
MVARQQPANSDFVFFLHHLYFRLIVDRPDGQRCDLAA